MAYSNDSEDTFPDAIFDYCFYDKRSQLISFAQLPVQWNEAESSTFGSGARHIYMCGDVYDGPNRLIKSYHQVKAWKFNILTENPEISVLLEDEDGLPLEKEEDDHWIKLKNPSKTYENFSRSILASMHFLWLFKNKPEASWESLVDHLSKAFSSFDIMPSIGDLVENINFIKEVTKRDEALTNSKLLVSFLENPIKNNSSVEEKI